jgi:hypothetical protein
MGLREVTLKSQIFKMTTTSTNVLLITVFLTYVMEENHLRIRTNIIFKHPVALIYTKYTMIYTVTYAICLLECM